jgi:uncharacterized protein with ATP-grasp and redox domains
VGDLLSKIRSPRKKWRRPADLVISKGRGNYKGLCGIDKNMYFILMAKCDHVAAHPGVPKGDFVIAKA